MRIGMLGSTVKAVCGFQISRLFLKVNGHHIDDLSAFHVERYANTPELSLKHWQIKMQYVIAGEITTLQETGNHRRDLVKSGLIFDILVTDPMDCGCFPWNSDLGIDACLKLQLLPIWGHLKNTDLHNAI